MLAVENLITFRKENGSLLAVVLDGLIMGVFLPEVFIFVFEIFEFEL